MAINVVAGDLVVQGNFSAQTMSVPSGTVVNTTVAAGAAIATSKMDHRHAGRYADESTTVSAAQTRYLGAAHTAGTLQSVAFGVYTLPVTGTETVIFDLKRATAGGSLATVLSGTVSITKDSTAKLFYAGTLAYTALAAGDTLWLVITISGSGGTQGKGLYAEVVWDEAAA